MSDSTPTPLHQRLCYLEAALDQVDEAIVWTDAAGTIQSCNAAFSCLVNRPVPMEDGSLWDQLPLRRWGNPLPPASHPATLANTVARSGQECYEYGAGDRPRWLQITWSPLPAGNAHQSEAAGTLFLIRELLHQPPANQQQASDQLEQRAELAQNDLLYIQQPWQAEAPSHPDRETPFFHAGENLDTLTKQHVDKFSNLFDLLPDTIFVVARETMQIIYCNDTCASQMFASRRQEIEGKTLFACFAPEDAQRLAESNQRVFTSGQPLRTQETFILPQGVTHFDTVKIPLKRPNGEVYALLGSARNITELVEIRDALEISEERLRLALDAADMGVWDLDLVTGKETWSTRTEPIFGFAPGSFTGSNELFLSRIHADDREQTRQKHSVALLTGRYHNEFRVVHPDRSLHWVETWGKVFYDAMGNPVSIRGVNMDITERKQAEETLRLREQAIVASSNGIVIADARQPDMPIVYVNPAFEQQTGYRADEVLSRNCRFLQRDDRNQPELAQLRLALQTGTSCTITLRNYRKDGSLFWNQLSVSPIFDANQTLTHFVGIQTDVSDRKYIEAERIRTEAALRQSETNLAESQRIARLGNWQYDLITQKITWSEEVFRIYRLDPTQPEPTYEEFLQYAHADNRQQFLGLVQRALEQAEPYESDFRIIRADGSTGYVFAKGQPILDGTGQVTHLFGIIMDISDRKQVEAELLRQKEYLRLILDNIPQQVFWKDVNLVFQGCNKHWAEAAFLDSPAAVIGKTDYDLLPNREIADLFREQDLHIMATNTPQLHLVAAKQRPGKDGQTIWLDISKIPVHDAENNVIGIVGVLEDITERKLAEEQIKTSLQEKEVLLKEIHHRVKNNLQMVFSLLNLQTSTIQDAGIRSAIKDTQNRVKAMALIHEKLYQSTNLSKIRIADYIQQLTTDLVRSYRSNTSIIDLDLQIDDVELTIDTIIPCGLIISELVSNAMKYAFSDGRQGCVRVSFFRKITGQYQLEVADNGVGIPVDVDFRNTQSLGMQLVCAFTNQLRGTIELDKANGSTFRITFDTLL